MSYPLCLERLRAGTASIEYLEEDKVVEGERRFMARVQFSGVGHVLANLTQDQVDALKAAAKETKT